MRWVTGFEGWKVFWELLRSFDPQYAADSGRLRSRLPLEEGVPADACETLVMDEQEESRVERIASAIA